MEKFHFTKKDNLDSIITNGLTTSVGDNSNVIGDKRNAIYYSEGIEGLLSMYFMMRNIYKDLCENENYLYVPLEFYKEKMDKYKGDDELYAHYKYEVKKLQNALEESIRAKSFDSPEEYYGMDYLLMFDKDLDVPEDKDIRYQFYNKWTNNPISKDSIKIAYISDGTNKIFDYKSIIDYCVSISNLGELINILCDEEEYENEITVATGGEVSYGGLFDTVEDYYKRNQDRLREEYKGYSIHYMSLYEYSLGQANSFKK
jgi:hypothetical protein